MKRRKSGADIPEDRDKYFQPFPADADPTEYKMIDVNKLIRSKLTAPATDDRSSETDRAIDHIRGIGQGRNGESPRAPIDVVDNKDGTFLVIDGNATHEAAERLGWTQLPCRVISTHLEDAIAIAASVHRGQRDKGGAAYLTHPLRLMMKMSTPDAMIAAVLHDVVEDSSIHDKWTFQRLRDAGFSETVLAAVDAVTDRKAEGESYEAFVERAASNPIARAVKIADLEDNMNMLRLDEVTIERLDRLARYHRSWKRLTADGSKEDTP